MNEWMRRFLALPEQASTFAKSVDYLHYSVILTSMVGALGIGALAIYYSWRYQAEDGPLTPRPPTATTPVIVELGIIGGLVTMFLIWWVVGFIEYIRITEPPPDSMTIYVVGKQWMWSFAYPNGGGSEGVLYVPERRSIKLVMTSRDVIHSFYVPAFRVKRDVIPGRSTTMWFEVDHPGHYRIECAELCGVGHSTMRGEVIVMSEQDYARKLADLEPTSIAPPTPRYPAVVNEESPAPLLSLAAMGREIAADAGCLRCHTVDGTPHVGPTWAGLYQASIRLQSGATIIADEAYLTKSMMDPAADIHLGFPNVMPSYQGLLAAPQVGALVEYIRSLRDVPRHDGKQPLPAATRGAVPLVTPLPGDTPSTEPSQAPIYAPPGGSP